MPVSPEQQRKYNRSVSRVLFDIHKARWIEKALDAPWDEPYSPGMVRSAMSAAFERGRQQGYAMAQKGIKP